MSTSPLRLVRLAPDPLGLYVRAGRLDQKDLQSFITSGSVAFTGVVFEAKRVGQQKELLSLVLERGLDAVLDPQTQAMGTVGGYAKGMDGLAWSKKRPMPWTIWRRLFSKGSWPRTSRSLLSSMGSPR